MATRPRAEVNIEPIDLKPDIAIGIKLPFSGTSGRLFDLSFSTEDQAISNLKNLLLTQKGERRMQPTFGSSIYELVFEQNVQELPGLLRAQLLSDIQFWLPYIVVDNVNITQKLDSEPGPIGHGLDIKLDFRVTEQGANRSITFIVEPNGNIILN